MFKTMMISIILFALKLYISLLSQTTLITLAVYGNYYFTAMCTPYLFNGVRRSTQTGEYLFGAESGSRVEGAGRG